MDERKITKGQTMIYTTLYRKNRNQATRASLKTKAAFQLYFGVLDTTCDKCVSDLRQVDALLRILRLPHTIKLNATV